MNYDHYLVKQAIEELRKDDGKMSYDDLKRDRARMDAIRGQVARQTGMGGDRYSKHLGVNALNDSYLKQMSKLNTNEFIEAVDKKRVELDKQFKARASAGGGDYRQILSDYKNRVQIGDMSPDDAIENSAVQKLINEQTGDTSHISTAKKNRDIMRTIKQAQAAGPDYTKITGMGDPTTLDGAKKNADILENRANKLHNRYQSTQEKLGRLEAPKESKYVKGSKYMVQPSGQVYELVPSELSGVKDPTKNVAGFTPTLRGDIKDFPELQGMYNIDRIGREYRSQATSPSMMRRVISRLPGRAGKIAGGAAGLAGAIGLGAAAGKIADYFKRGETDEEIIKEVVGEFLKKDSSKKPLEDPITDPIMAELGGLSLQQFRDMRTISEERPDIVRDIMSQASSAQGGYKGTTTEDLRTRMADPTYVNFMRRYATAVNSARTPQQAKAISDEILGLNNPQSVYYRPPAEMSERSPRKPRRFDQSPRSGLESIQPNPQVNLAIVKETVGEFLSKAKKKGGKKKDPRLERAGVEGYNKPKRTPKHPKKSHIVVAKEGDKIKTIRYGEQGAKTAGDPKKGESAKMKKKRKSFKARHRKNIKRGKMSAAYWADKSKW